MSEAAHQTLIVIEQDHQGVRPGSLHAIAAARSFDAPCVALCIGHGIDSVAQAVAQYGCNTVYLADDGALERPLADRYAAVIAYQYKACDAQRIMAASSTFSRDILPRVAALIDAPMLSDVTRIQPRDGQIQFDRPWNAGSEIAVVETDGLECVLSVRPAAFDMPERTDAAAPVRQLTVSNIELPNGMEFIDRDVRQSERPELTDARIVVAGGRPIADRETFERLIGGLADTLGAAVGTTRPLVDAEIVPNDWQVGQTGKIISPDLYIAVGISGSVQHLAGINDAGVIVAINRDPSAPMMQRATYALAGDLFEIVPQLIEALSAAE